MFQPGQQPKPQQQPRQPQAAPQPLAPGDFLPDFQLPDHLGRSSVLATQMLGKPVVLLFYPGNAALAAQKHLKRFAALGKELEAVAHVFAITGDQPDANAKAANLTGFPFQILCDGNRQLAAAYQVQHNLQPVGDPLAATAITCVIGDRNRRLVRIDRDVTDADYADKLLAELADWPEPPAVELPAFAPVLYVPRVLEPEFCRHLMEIHEADNEPSYAQQDSYGEARHNTDATVKVRRDHYVRDPALFNDIKWRVGRRVLPEIEKAFFYRVTGVEEFKICRYDAETHGHFIPHRDNNNLSSAHRRFAMTLNLNPAGPEGDYDGGFLRFPEYGPHLYRPGAGDAVIFSCSLLHEATEVTRGQRYVLLSFMFGADGQEILRRNQARGSQ
jgi:peroxiredoxin/predicted 2-oxoglutarate/Fe(II)-dependent dioxygenase YbiX